MSANPAFHLRMTNTVGPVSLAFLVSAGQLKATVLMSWFPVDLTLFAFTIVVVCAAVRLPSQPLDSRSPLLLIALLVSFAFASISPPTSEYAHLKVLTLFSVTAALMLTPFVLLRTRQQQRLFFSSLLVVSVALTVALAVSPHNVSNYSNIITLEGNDTIGSARVVGVGVLVVLFRLVWDPLRIRTGLSYLAILPPFLWGMLSTGSRGPVLAILLASLTATIVAVLRRQRILKMAMISILTVGGTALATQLSPGDGTRRIFSFFEGARDGSTAARSYMWNSTLAAIPDHPLGIGMGSFYARPDLSAGTRYPHSILLETFLEAGWLAGLLLSFILLLGAVRASCREQNTESQLVLAMLIYTFVNAMVSGDINDNRLLWPALSMALARVSQVTPTGPRLPVIVADANPPTLVRPLRSPQRDAGEHHRERLNDRYWKRNIEHHRGDA